MAENYQYFFGGINKMKGTTRKTLFALLMVASFSFLATGCAQKEVPVEEPTAQEMTPPVEEPTEPMVMPEPEPAPEPMMESHDILEGRTSGPMLPVYFDFDRSNIRDDQKQRLEGNAAYLKDHPDMMIRIEGNCDERGTNEYNMALGDRRAQSAKKYLMNLGVSGGQLDTISFGEEKPLNFGHNELAWSQNRRDDFVITNP